MKLLFLQIHLSLSRFLYLAAVVSELCSVGACECSHCGCVCVSFGGPSDGISFLDGEEGTITQGTSTHRPELMSRVVRVSVACVE